MANNTKYTGLTNYANYHTFSKLQVGNNVNFGGSINRSGHTVTNTDAWLDDVPFFNTFTTPSAALDAVGKSTVKNDLVSIAVAEGDITPGIYRRNEVANTDGTKTFSEIFDAYTIGTDTKDGAPVLLNKNDKAVVRVWNKQALTLLTGTNNSNANAEGQAARIIVDGTPVEQFIAVPDVSRSGYPSNGYGIKVYNDGTAMTMDFGTVENTFFDVPFAGVIMFGGGTDGSVYTIDCFEYIGDKLAAVNTKIADIQDTIENLSIEAGAGIKTITPAEGSGITVITSGAEGASSITPIIGIDTEVVATKASVDEVAKDVTEIQQTIESGVVSSVTASTTAQAAGVTITGESTAPVIEVTVGSVADGNTAVVTGGAVHTAIASATSTLEGKITEASNTAASELSKARGEITKEIGDAASAAQSAAEGTAATALAEAKEEIKAVTDDHATRINTLETAGYATVTEVATAKSEAIAAAKSETETQVGAAKDAIKLVTDDHASRIGAIEAVYATKTEVGTAKSEAIEAAKGETTSQVNALGATSLAATSTESDDYQVKVTTTGTVADGIEIQVNTKDIASAQALADLTASVNKHMAEAAGTYLGIEIVTDGLDSVTEPKTNKIYLVPLDTEEGREKNIYTEYIYTDGKWEVIGTTAIDISTLEAAAEKAQGDIDAHKAAYATDKAALEASIATKAAQTDLDATNTALGTLEETVGTLTETVTNNKTATDAAIALKADQTSLDATNAEVAKKANSADVYTKDEVDAAQEVTDAAIEAAAAKGQQGISDAAAALAAAQAAQGTADTAVANAATAQAAADAAQGEVDALEGVVSALSQVVADNKSATDAAIATKAAQTALDETNATVAEHTASITEITGTTIPTITGRLDAIEAIPTVEVVASTAADKYIEVTSATADGKTTFTVGTTAALEGRLDAIDEFIGTSEGSDLADLLAAKVDTVTGGSNGITVSTADTEAGRVATLTVTPDTAVTQDSANVVTSGAVHTAITASASATLDSAKSYAEEQVKGLTDGLNTTVTAENTTISVTQTDGKVTAVTVTKGAVADKDTNLVDGSTVYAVTSALQTTVDKKVDSTTYTTDKQAIDAAIENLQSFADGADDAYAVKGTEQVAADAAAAAAAAQGSADKKIASISNNSDARVIIGTPTTDGDGKSVTISLATTVATTTDGTAYSKSETDDAIATAVGTAVQSVALATDNTQTAISIATSDANAVTVTVADNIATVDKVTVAEDGSITVDTEGTTYSKATVDKMVAEAKPENFVAAISGYDATGTLQTTTQGATIKVVDERGDNVTANDLWATSATLSADGTLSITGDYISPTVMSWGAGIVKSIKDNKAYTLANASGEVYANIQTDKIKSSNGLFYLNTELVSFDSDLSSLINGYTMFAACGSLSSFDGNLSSLTDGQLMFADCIELSNFNVKLDSLKDATNMFMGCEKLSKFEIKLPSLVWGEGMFECCVGLESFTADLSSLEDGNSMFSECSALQSFTGDLSSLKGGQKMFNQCILDTDSVICIADSIKDWKELGGNHTITIHVGNTSDEEIPGLLTEIANKGWTVATNYPNWAGPVTSAIDGEEGTSQPIFAIACPVENEKYATHKNAAGEFFAVEIANMVIGPEVHKWAIFATAEDAITEWDLTPVTK
jgi:hypothetical protein